MEPLNSPRRRGPAIRILPLVLGLIAAGIFIARGCQEGPFGRNQVVARTAA